ncbi:MAG TPA: ribosome-associated translation inhibitor RaiA [Armatimonadaceae bacterium]|nr:ribosome-associated translation inhibitor RaiA [Armatimonadaceae bacterium]
MQVQVRGKGVVVTDALREYADRKMNKLHNHFQNLTGATVTQSIQGTEQRVEVLLEGDGVKVRCEERGDDLYAAMDRVVDKLGRQMRKFKDRAKRNGHLGGHHHHHYGHHGEVASPRTAPVELEGLQEEPATGRIVRTKRFEIKPITPHEAVEQMELLSHDFFVFENAESNQVNVLYRRGDGNYGILEPEH